MYNDVPFDPSNPFPGELYNYPGNSPNVYEGVVVDYEGDEVTPENLLKVLTGDESTGKKVLKSTEKDNLMVSTLCMKPQLLPISHGATLTYYPYCRVTESSILLLPPIQSFRSE